MATLNYGSRQLDCKIVYYGPALGGKTTNLKHIHEVLPSEACGELTNLATKQDRTLYFDLLPVNLGKLGDYYVKMHLYTVPGQVYYNATRRVVLSGVDGVVMVFDSDPERENENYQSLANLEENLASYGLSMEDVPIVFQFNKRDLRKAMSLRFMSRSLNPDRLYPEFEATAIEGIGVEETLKAISSQVFGRLERELPQRESPRPHKRVLRPAEGPEPQDSEPLTPSAIEAFASTRADSSADSSPTVRLRQLSDLRIRKVPIGHAIIDLAPGGAMEGAPDYAAVIEFHPVLGQARLEKLSFWRTSEQNMGGDVEVFESRAHAGQAPAKMMKSNRKGAIPEVFLNWPTRLGHAELSPQGSTRLRSE